MQVRLLKTGVLAPPDEYTREWIEPGGYLNLGNGCLLHYLVHRMTDGERQPELILRLANGATFFAHLDGPPLDGRPYARVCIIPRAVEMDEDKPGRLLVELVSLRLKAAG